MYRQIYYTNPTTGKLEVVENEITNYLDCAQHKLSYLLKKKPIFASDSAKKIKDIDDNNIIREYFGNPWNVEDCYLFQIEEKQYIFALKYNYRRHYDNYSIAWRVYYPEGKPQRKRPETEYAKLNYYRQEKERSPRNSCQIQALTQITGDKFDNILELMEYGGWNETNTGNVANGDRWNDLLDCYGYKKKCFWSRWNHNDNNDGGTFARMRSKTMTVNTAAKKLPKKGKFAITISGHVLTFVDGELFDNSDNRRNLVVSIFEIIEK